MNKIIKEKAYTIRGIVILLIILCHTPTFIANYCHTNVAVSIFFFFTGYFVMNNYIEKNNYLNKKFLLKKLFNIYLPFVVSNIIYILIYFITTSNKCFNSILDLILKIFGIIPINGYLWFIPHILIYYIFFYAFYYKHKNLNIRFYLILYVIYISIVIGVFSILKIWGGYIPFEHISLLVGSIYSLTNYKNSKTYSNKSKIIFCILFLATFIYNILHTNLITTVITQITAPFFLLIVIKYNKILDYIGKNSLLLYLYHILIIMVLNKVIKNNELIYIVLYLLLNIILIVIWKFIEKNLSKLLKGDKYEIN